MIHVQAKLIEILDKSSVPYEVLSHEPVHTMEDVLRVLKVPLEQTAKTLVVKCKDELVLAVISGDKRLSKKLLASALGVGRGQLDMLSPEKVESLTRMPLGGVPPFGIEGRVVIDKDVMRQSQIYCGFGSLTNSLRVSPQDIQKVAGATVSGISN